MVEMRDAFVVLTMWKYAIVFTCINDKCYSDKMYGVKYLEEVRWMLIGYDVVISQFICHN